MYVIPRMMLVLLCALGVGAGWCGPVAAEQAALRDDQDDSRAVHSLVVDRCSASNRARQYLMAFVRWCSTVLTEMLSSRDMSR